MLSACKPETKKSDPLFKLLSSAETGIHFSNDIRQTDSLNILEYMYFYNGGGVGLGDINNDGLTDVFLSGNIVSSKLYLNKGNFQFEDITAEAGVTTKGWCTGVAMADVNSDGFVDIYVSRAGSQNPADRTNLFFVNNGNNTFNESALSYGIADTAYTTQAAFFDYDKDGDVDLYLLNHDHSPKAVNTLHPKRKNGEAKNTDELFRNNGNGPAGHPTFTNVSQEAGILTEGYGLGVAINDLNSDGWPDIYVSNDFLSNDLLYINNQDGTFTNKISDYLKHQSYNGMGVDVSDFNNDGLPDIVVVDMLPEDNYRQKTMSGGMSNEKFSYMIQMGYEPQYMRNTLQLNNGNGHFSEIGQLAGIDKTDWSWSPLLADFDNDGFKDLFITNGYLKDITDKDFINYSENKKMFQEAKEANATLLALMDAQDGVKIPNYAFKNNCDLTFTKALDWGFDQPTYSNGAAFGDLDNDGDLDLVINNINDPASVYKNEAQRLDGRNYLQVSLQGDSLNRMALGAKVVLKYKGNIQLHEHTLYRGYQSTVDNTVHFGLGKVNTVDTIDIYWPDGRKQQLLHVKANQRLTINHRQAKNSFNEQKESLADQPVFSEVSREYGIHFLHKENRYSDLTAQTLLPHTHSYMGPSMSAGDVDGNGLDDFFIGGSAGNPGMLYLQQPSGKFIKHEFPDDAGYEDMGSLLFDADNDGDLDLYVVSGGTEFIANSENYQDRLYKNDGKGKFQKDMAALPSIKASESVVTAADFDGDGDLDLFVGGRVLPEKYPQAPQSYILRNEAGKFKDVTNEVGAELRNIGMVTAALWTDFDNDRQVDLLIVGEWMPVTFFKNVKGKLVPWNADEGKISQQLTVNRPQKNSSSKNKSPTHSITHLLNASSGWWNSLAGGDMDNDGDIDYILGNVGLNTPFKASEDEPLTIYSGDLDGTGIHHAILARYAQGKNYPWHSRDVLLRQMPRLGKKFFKYNEYAKATMDDIVSPEVRDKALVLESNYFASSYMENLGQGKFSLKALPIQAQFAPVHGILIKDVDNDGNLDVLLTGNSYAPDVSIGRYDAFSGLYLRGDGKGNFSSVHLGKSGFFMDADARSLIQLYTGNGDALIIGSSNADSLQVYSTTVPQKSKLYNLDGLDAFGTLRMKNAKSRKVEFYYASGYLSQSSRTLEIPEEVEYFEIVDSRGKAQKHVNKNTVSVSNKRK
ncbi:VCBS repeat-containing protein [Rhodocytophaga rosea]|uniref:VCBS repeat-containing protein n=1 Tax=Rhodocytophaga rosea TaxID=2704465 RepID=A0A6C0GTI5_9BACT|nr:VCBS repeat-containing protein [Rhodocytophaga rosea]QHT71475.1 VCBS repeat-containing protein [Rhodocytophaga rosea]